mgnify:CR=1 FL=1
METVEKVIWNDHSHSRNDAYWEVSEIEREAAKPLPITTYGVVVVETNEILVLASDFDELGRCRYWSRIIKSQILGREAYAVRSGDLRDEPSSEEPRRIGIWAPTTSGASVIYPGVLSIRKQNDDHQG